MADDQDDELLALKHVLEACRAQAIDLDMPALGYILGKAEASLAAHVVRGAPSLGPHAPVLSAPRGRIVRH